MTYHSSFLVPIEPSYPRIAFVTDVPKKGTNYALAEGALHMLNQVLGTLDLSYKQVLIASVLQENPGFIPTGKGFNWHLPKNESQTLALENALSDFNPTVIVTLGTLALKYFKRKADQLDKERGAPFKVGSCLFVPTYHPREVFAIYNKLPLFSNDIAKAVRLAKDGWKLPEMRINYLPSFNDVTSMLGKFIEHKPYLAVDIETTYTTGICTCIGMAYSLQEALVIPFISPTKPGRYWSKDEEKIIWRLLQKALQVCLCVGHNSCHFDFSMLARKHGIVANFVDDTMFAMWSCYPEFKKSLSFCSSIFTDNPYWKDELKLARSGAIPRSKEFEYCGRDCIITMQCAKALGEELKELGEDVREHYKFNIRVSRAYEYMALTGATIDVDKLNQRVVDLSATADKLQEEINKQVGKPLNVRSPKQVKTYLYERLKLPERIKKFKNPDGTEGERVTSDYLTILYLGRQYEELPVITQIGKLRKLYKRISALTKIGYDKKHICRWGYNVVGTETGRSSGYKPLIGEGVQPQNVDRRDRDLFLPPEGYYWCKADLEGADSVTVAACLEALGYPRLHEDIKNHVKPAQVLALAMLLGDEVMGWSLNKIKEQLPILKSDKGKTMYRVAKAINHGSAYMLSPAGMHSNIFLQSDGELFVTPTQCKISQELLFSRYYYPAYHRQVQTIMNTKKFLKTGHGQCRTFFGRYDNSTLREMLAYLPQAHTAFVTNTTIERLYKSPENRTPDGNLFLRLCNQVHDETDFYFPIGEETRTRELFNSCKEVPLTIWNVPFLIEFDAAYGSSWGVQSYSL